MKRCMNKSGEKKGRVSYVKRGITRDYYRTGSGTKSRGTIKEKGRGIAKGIMRIYLSDLH